jgi:hypothetical protein
MCVPYNQRDPKARRLIVIGNLSLMAALLFWQFARPSGATAREWSDGLCGLLFGISIGINLLVLRSGRRCAS